MQNKMLKNFLKLLSSLILTFFTTISIAGSGTGFFITSDGYFLTNYHVIENAKKIMIYDNSGYSHNAEIVKTNKHSDLALLKLTGEFVPLILQNSKKVSTGEEVLTIGFPLIDIQGIEPKMTEGIISSKYGLRDDKRMFQISVPIQPGNSGGPLLNHKGNVVGIVNARLSKKETMKIADVIPENVNLAIKTEEILNFLNDQKDLFKQIKLDKGKNEDIKLTKIFKKNVEGVATVVVEKYSDEKLVKGKEKSIQNVNQGQSDYRDAYDVCDDLSDKLNTETPSVFNDDFYLTRTICLPDPGQVTMMYYLQTTDKLLTKDNQKTKDLSISQANYLCSDEDTKLFMNYYSYEYIMIGADGEIIDNFFVTNDICKEI